MRILTKDCNLLPGDILTQVDGYNAEKQSQASLRQLLAKAGAELQITIAPLSPLRKRRPSSTRLHETVWSTFSVSDKTIDEAARNME